MLTPPRPSRRLAALLFALALLPVSGLGERTDTLPPIVFVRRELAPDSSSSERRPLGPASGTRGRLWVREPGGALRELPIEKDFADVADPCVAPNGRTIAFVATRGPAYGWSLWTVDLAGSELLEHRLGQPGDVLSHPAWISSTEIVLARGSFERPGLYRPGLVFDLWLWDLDLRTSRRLTLERLGAESPSFDPARGRLLFARWWSNPFLPADGAPEGLARDGFAPARADTVSVWHAMEMPPRGGLAHVAAGDPASRRGAMAYAPVALPGGDVLGTYALNTSLTAPFGACGIQRLDAAGKRAPEILAGPALADADSTAYGSTRGLASPSACAPAALDRDRVVFAFDPGGRGDFGLWLAGPGGARRTLVDEPGVVECEPAIAIAWRPEWLERAKAERSRFHAEARATLAPDRVPRSPGEAGTFTYENRDVFAGVGAPPRGDGARLRFFALYPAHAGGDSAAVVREVEVLRNGRVSETGLPAWTPMFEQLVDASGRVLRTRHGPAHVAGLNVAPAGATIRCVGCHAGHSRIAAGERRKSPLAVPAR